MEITKVLRLPTEAVALFQKREFLKRELLKQSSLLSTRIAILGGSTTAELKGMLELFLLTHGIKPLFYESEYNRYYEDVVFENPGLWNFRPEIVFIDTTWRNISQFPNLMETDAEVESHICAELARFESVWSKIHGQLGALIIQNNFDLPDVRPLGNLDTSEPFGRINFLLRLNARFATYAAARPRFVINDILYLSTQVGAAQWFAPTYWYNFHMALSPVGTVALAKNVAGLIKAAYGLSKKCLVLDLDNTLWGGVIGDDGVDKLILGREHPIGEAFSDFQRYVKELHCRGVILVVCSKNDLETAKEGFSHPDSVLRLQDFSAFKANWNPKPENIREIAAELNIGLDSMVFVDDNPAERALVANQLPEVAVPDMGSDVSRFPMILEQERYFEAVTLGQDDVNRASYYRSNKQREALRGQFREYSQFLASLEMTADVGRFLPIYLERISQLINKTNQFNLTTRRYTVAEVEAIAQDPNFITLYGRLADRFGDNGLVSVLIARVFGDSVEVELWLMSCRVLNRQMELIMFDALVEQCQLRGIRTIVGIYIPSKKNSMVAGHYASLGFARLSESCVGHERWQYDIPEHYSAGTRHIRRTAEVRPEPVNASDTYASPASHLGISGTKDSQRQSLRTMQ